MEKTIKLSSGKEVIVKEMKYIDASEIDTNGSKKEGILKMFKFSTNLTEEEISDLSIKDGQLIEKSIAEINELKTDVVNFTNPTEKKE
jgi:hypothetical protein